MYTVVAMFLVCLFAWLAKRAQDKDRPEYDGHLNEANALLLLHIRQDIRLVANLLGGVIVMLGLVADRAG
jgi:hypothetical protein